MSREMISAIARDFNKNMCSDREVLESCTECAGSIENSPCPLYEIATRIYNAGYRKQEWISVYERLPETETPVIIFTKKGTYYVGYYYKGAVNPGFTGFYSNGCKRDATHWMPLPEHPKMKGGAE